MLNPAELEQSAVKACVDALVDGRGGLLLYDHGLAGRESLIAAGAQLAVTAGLPFTLVDAEALRDDTAALLDQLGLQQHVFLSPAEAALWPAGFTPNGVLAIHADVLLDPAVKEPLLAAAREASRAGHLLVARRPDGTSLVDAHTAQTHRLIADPVPAQTQDSTIAQARYEPGPPDMSSREEYRMGHRLLGLSNRSPGSAADGVEDWRTQLERAPLRLTPNEQAADWDAWTQLFMDADTPFRPNRMDEETVRSLQWLLEEQGVERMLSRLQRPDATSVPGQPLADIPRPIGSPSLTEEHEDPQHLSATSTPSTPPAPEHGPTHVMRRQTPAEREEGDWSAWATRKERLIRELTSPTAPDTGSTEADVVSAEEPYTTLEGPDALRRVQQLAESVRAQSQARQKQAAAATAPRQAVTEERAHHDTMRHTHNQDQTVAPQPPGQNPGR